MDIKRIIYYTSNRDPLSLRNFTFKPRKCVEDIFDAAEDAEDVYELMDILKTIFEEPIQLDRCVHGYVRFRVLANSVNIHFLKFDFGKRDE